MCRSSLHAPIWCVIYALLATKLAYSGASAVGLEWLAKMNYAMQSLSYSGDLYYYRGEEHMTLHMRQFRNVDGLIEVELTRTDVPRLTRNRDTNPTSISFSQENSSVPAAATVGEEDIQGIHDLIEVATNYHVEPLGSEMVAGRECAVIQLKPHHSDRNLLVFWLDDVTGIPLRTEVREASYPHSVMESMRFTNVNVDATSTANSKPLNPRELFGEDWNRQASVETDPCLRSLNNCWQATVIPEGFELRSQEQMEHPVTHSRMFVMHFTDAVVSFSVFIHRLTDDEQVFGPQEHGGHVVVKHKLSVSPQLEYVVTVVGDIPSETADKVAQGVVHFE